VDHKYYDWDLKKNEWLKEHREICFEDIVPIIEGDGQITIAPNPNAKKYPNQKIFVIDFKDYIYLVPFVEDEEKIFLKTIYPSRKANKLFKKKI